MLKAERAQAETVQSDTVGYYPSSKSVGYFLKVALGSQLHFDAVS